MLNKISEEARFWAALDSQYSGAVASLREIVSRMTERGFSPEEIRTDLERRVFGAEPASEEPEPKEPEPKEPKPKELDAEMKVAAIKYICTHASSDGSMSLDKMRAESLAWGIDSGQLEKTLKWNLGDAVRVTEGAVELADNLRRRVLAFHRWLVAGATVGDQNPGTFVGVPEGGEYFFWELGAEDCWSDVRLFPADIPPADIAADISAGADDVEVLVFGEKLERLYPPATGDEDGRSRQICDFCAREIHERIKGTRATGVRIYGQGQLLQRVKETFSLEIDRDTLRSVLEPDPRFLIREHRVSLNERR